MRSIFHLPGKHLTYFRRTLVAYDRFVASPMTNFYDSNTSIIIINLEYFSSTRSWNHFTSIAMWRCPPAVHYIQTVICIQFRRHTNQRIHPPDGHVTTAAKPSMKNASLISILISSIRTPSERLRNIILPHLYLHICMGRCFVHATQISHISSVKYWICMGNTPSLFGKWHIYILLLPWDTVW